MVGTVTDGNRHSPENGLKLRVNQLVLSGLKGVMLTQVTSPYLVDLWNQIDLDVGLLQGLN